MSLVYDVQDTEGEALPEDAAIFPVRGEMQQKSLDDFKAVLEKKGIEWLRVDSGDRNAGLIRVVYRAVDEKEATIYRMHINRNHEPAAQFVTLTHELGHLFLGHLGLDKKRNVPDRVGLSLTQEEIEAESVAFIVCRRNDIEPKSQTYLANFAKGNSSSDQFDIYQIMRAAGQVEKVLGLGSRSMRFGTK